MQKLRTSRELEKMSCFPPPGISISATDSNYNSLEAKIVGPAGTPYESGVFKLQIAIPERYPFLPPAIKFATQVYHPNIDESGRICLDLLQMPPKGKWRPTIGIEGLLIAIRMLLESPNPDDPLMTEIAEEYKNAHSIFVNKAHAFTQKHACN